MIVIFVNATKKTRFAAHANGVKRQVQIKGLSKAS